MASLRTQRTATPTASGPAPPWARGVVPTGRRGRLTRCASRLSSLLRGTAASTRANHSHATAAARNRAARPMTRRATCPRGSPGCVQAACLTSPRQSPPPKGLGQRRARRANGWHTCARRWRRGASASRHKSCQTPTSQRCCWRTRTGSSGPSTTHLTSSQSRCSGAETMEQQHSPRTTSHSPSRLGTCTGGAATLRAGPSSGCGPR
mmetsp:Transcript_11362/g.27865  ORF Transcript_11362/g.27865 Transcript_11362/m.27865 type:complete len:207 (+) Transcript_11362:439-1059(+)